METSKNDKKNCLIPYRTVVIEDQTLFRDILVHLVESDSDYSLVGKASSGTEGWEVCRQTKPDLILMDLQIPEPNGIQLGERILQITKDVHILALTSLTDSSTTNRVYEAGFHGYVEKDQPVSVLREAMLTVAEGGFYFTELVRKNQKKIQTDPNAFQKFLSPKEIRVLTEVAKGLTSQEIAESLELSKRTVENHRHRIMQKLQIRNASGLVRFAMDNNLTALS